MNSQENFLALPVLAVVAATLWFFYVGVPAVLQVLRRPTTPIGQLAAGPVEIRGVIEAERPVPDARGRPCAAIALSYGGEWAQRGKGGKLVDHSEEAQGQVVGRGLTVRDATGSCRLVFADHLLEVSADSRLSRFDLDGARELLARCPGHASVVTVRPQVTLRERSIRVGRRVLVSGQASEDLQAPPDGYRGGAGRAFVLGPSTGRKLLVSAGSQRQTLARAAGPLGLALVFTGALLGLAWQAWAIQRGVG